ncbi:MAG: hypothetical protein JSR54_05885, partial [Proteobacteria bacterium]|nr:hypothetical protein [Pseudomonadota bacterium]
MRTNQACARAVAAILSAQAAAALGAEAAAPQSGIEEIIVTAQRRTENVQNVPIAIQAVTS